MSESIPEIAASIRQHHFAFIAVLPWYSMPSLNFIFCYLDMTAVHLSAIVGTLPGRGLHRIVYYFKYNIFNRAEKQRDFVITEIKNYDKIELYSYSCMRY